ncbi:histidine triad nucleotide-binding protein [Candidatus Berkelbacteria bacterium]|nr:histidine triad nucleotide-binding protein [Candidatus Berkelbacteria bacterium]
MPDCIFCKIIRKEMPATIVWESDTILAFDDGNPQAPVHVLIVPKEHSETYTVFLGKAASEVAKVKGVGESGYRLIVNLGPDAGQEIAHLHMHLIGGKKLGPMISK